MRGRNAADTYLFKGETVGPLGICVWFEQQVPLDGIVPDNFLVEIFGRPHCNLYYKFYGWDTGVFHDEPGIWTPIIGSVPSQWMEVLVRDIKLVEEIYDR